MYGDCQVLSSMGGGNGVSSESLFSSPPPPMQNPNFHFMASINPFHNFPPNLVPKEEMVMMRGKEEIESGSGSEHMEGVSGNEQESEQQQPKKKRYHRHTARQIQEMEAYVSLSPTHNIVSAYAAQHDRQDNVILRAENENLKNENYRLQAALRSILCPNCGGPAMLGEMGYDEQQLRIENARLKEEDGQAILGSVHSLASSIGHNITIPSLYYTAV
ncbi:homeobox-7 [Actinidia rufa]|uniref:Homeobox-7 n=1 Tax=Actinidia rufa TaxID=165716 RepID=A0A7J0GXD9_9ERIC|nr:homeobox-7 [Actinidia rufa]